MSRMRANAAGVMADMMLTPMIVGMRLPMMAMEVGAFGPANETVRAFSEKAAAMASGFVEAQLSLSFSMMRIWPELMAARVPSAFTGAALEQAMFAAVAPARRTVRANYRRLSRRGV